MITVTIFTLTTIKRWRDPSYFKDSCTRRAYIWLTRIMEAITIFTLLLGLVAIFLGMSLVWQKITFATQPKEYRDAKIAVAELYGWEPQQVQFYRETVATPTGDYVNVYIVEKKALIKSEKPKVFYSSSSYLSSDGKSHSAKRLSKNEEKALGLSEEKLVTIIDQKINDCCR